MKYEVFFLDTEFDTDLFQLRDIDSMNAEQIKTQNIIYCQQLKALAKITQPFPEIVNQKKSTVFSKTSRA